jgi:oligoribonuclease NrnB/cAMP/cGMP phosphodiesterase (DHH superfamily)
LETLNFSEKPLMKKNDKTKNKIKNIAIIYHFPCYDGGYSAMNAYLYYQYLYSEKNTIHFFPSNSNNRLNEVKFEKYELVYILDKGLNEEDLIHIAEILKNTENIKIVLIDHHYSSIKLFDSLYEKLNFKNFPNFEIIFNDKNEKSACGLTFEYFKNKALKKFTQTQFQEVFTDNYKLVN